MKKKDQEKRATFVRLTRLDGSPLWLNASFVVTVEPRKGGGSIVVPIGDGLDYDVKETPETVLAALDGAPIPEVVPVPTSDALIPAPDDVSPESDQADDEEKEEDEAKPAAKPAKKASRKAQARKAAAAKESLDSASTPAPEEKPPENLVDDDIARLRKMAPRTVKKLQNTIMTQFKHVNAESAVAALVARGDISIDGTRVNWFMPGELNFAADIARAASVGAERLSMEEANEEGK